MPYLPPIYRFQGFRFDPSEVDIRLEDKKLHINAKGLLYRVTLWETPILATVSELFSGRWKISRQEVYGGGCY